MHIEMFSNKHDCNAMIRMLYEVQQKEDETVEEYMLHIHDAVMVIHCMYLEHLPDCGRDLKKDHFYHRLHPYLHDALSFAMAKLPKGNRLALCLIHYTLLQRSWRLGRQCRHAIMPLAQILIKRSTDATLHQKKGWQSWRRKEWHQPTPPLGRTLSQKWRSWMVSTST